MRKLVSILLLSLLSAKNGFSAAVPIPFSPYADITLSPVWSEKYQDLEPMDLLAVSKESGVKNFRLAFITDAGNCQPAWGGQSAYLVSAMWGKHLTDDLRANGVAYTVSFGGAAGNDISKACNADELLTALTNVVTIYQPQALDFDIENGTADVAKLMRALHVLQRQFPAIQLSFTLPVMPEGLTAAGKSVIQQAAANVLQYHVNIMAMDYGDTYTNDMAEYAIQAAKNVHAYLQLLYPNANDAALWQMIEVTPMIGVNDISIEQFTLNNAETLKQFANQLQLGALSMWDINRDKPCADKTTNLYCSGNNLQINPYDFSRRFMQ